ncbi:hypothetical protein EAO68_28615 [Streptomyces sp. wa22]|nr:hypothetical protein EAO68_28615 [Streptomyces sp. wa22]
MAGSPRPPGSTWRRAWWSAAARLRPHTGKARHDPRLLTRTRGGADPVDAPGPLRPGPADEARGPAGAPPRPLRSGAGAVATGRCQWRGAD